MAGWWEGDALADAAPASGGNWWQADQLADAPPPPAAPRVPLGQVQSWGPPGSKTTEPPLPQGYQGEGQPYQSGFVDWSPDGPGTQFYPGDVRVPGQGVLGATANAAAAGLKSGLGDIAASPFRAVQGASAATRRIPERMLRVMDRIDAGQSVTPTEDTFAYRDMTPEQRRAFRARVMGDVGRAPGPIESGAGAVADKISNAVSADVMRNNPIDPALADRFAVKLAAMAGSTAPYVVATALGGLPGAAAAGFGQAYEMTYQDAKRKGSDDRTAHTAALGNAVVQGGLTTIPAAQWLGRFTPQVQNALLGAVVGAAVHGGTMVGTTQMQELANNLFARGFYDPERPLDQRIGEDMLEQFTLGAVLPWAFQAPAAARRVVDRMRQPIADPALQAGVQAQQEAMAGVNERVPDVPPEPPPTTIGEPPVPPPAQVLENIAQGKPAEYQTTPWSQGQTATPTGEAVQPIVPQQVLQDIAEGRPAPVQKPAQNITGNITPDEAARPPGAGPAVPAPGQAPERGLWDQVDQTRNAPRPPGQPDGPMQGPGEGGLWDRVDQSRNAPRPLGTPDAPPMAPEKGLWDAPAKDLASPPPENAPVSPIVEHTTKKGKVLRGTIRRDLTASQAKELDPYTFKKDGGWFIREPVSARPTTEANEPAAVPSRPVPEGITPRPESVDYNDLVSGWARDHGPDAAMARVIERALLDRDTDGLNEGQPLRWQDLQGVAEQLVYRGKLAENAFSRDQLYDAIETGVNRYIQARPERFSPAVDLETAKRIASELAAIKERLPTQTVRAGDKDKLQQFSTPPDYAYAAAWLANLKPTDRIIEPSAGNGGLAVHAKNAGVAETVVNEISEQRRRNLEDLGFSRVTKENAEQLHNILPDDIKPTVVIMNPPFSSAGDRMGGKKVLDIGAQHVEQALQRLEPGGRLVAIVGRGMAPDAPTFRSWWKRIGEEYDVRANAGVGGKIYQKYGTTFATRVLVIDKVPPSGRPVVRNEVATAQELMDALAGVRDERPIGSTREQVAGEPAGPGLAGQGEGDGQPGSGVRAPTGPLGAGGGEGGSPQTPRPITPEPGGRGGSGGQPDAPRPPRGPSSDADPSVQSKPRPGGAVGQSGERPAESGDAGAGGVGGRGSPDRPDDRPAPVAPAETAQTKAVTPDEQTGGDLTESVYEPYKPQRVTVEGAKPHPGTLVQSAAMASVSPPIPKYNTAIPKKLIESGALSDAQLEAIIYAGNAHQQVLPPDTDGVAKRRGFFIGDGTGVGKGREVAGIILDNWHQGRRRAVWVSEKPDLAKDAKRDWVGLGQKAEHIVPLNKIKAGDDIKIKDGILFVSYDTLKSAEKIKTTGEAKPGSGKTRIQQIVDWLGKDFDGVIAYDEAHNMGNAIPTKGGRGKKDPAAKALAGVELQQALPNARVVYVSATGATEVSNLAFADRLGLWGKGTAFADRARFLNQVASGGVAAMELVARDMKALGHYMARNLSYDGVEYDRLQHTLTPDQRVMYDKIAEAWQVVLQNFHAALKETGADGKGGRKGAVASAFWGAHQRFFNQLITSMQMPSALKMIEKDIAEGRQAVLQLVNTNEAQQERAVNKAKAAGEENLEELDMSPRDQLMQLVEKAFPVQQFEEYIDENGIKRVRPVFDAAGNPVLNKKAVAAREKLLDELGSLRVPDGPLEILMNHFGPDAVAEVTGRKQRVVSKPDEKGVIRKVIDKRSGETNVVESNAFQDGKKKILVFSEAGGTGRSYHADNSSPSADARRAHYLIQAGWTASKAVQGFGRTHRTNQKSAPIFHLVTTDLEGQKRFISSIARRLGQLGALTKGERRTGDQGLFGLQDNLESDEAKAALQQFYKDVYRGGVEGVSMTTLERDMGLSLIDPTTNGLKVDLPPMQQFLNRILSLKVDDQNRVFGAFSDRFRDIIDAAKEAGTLDAGIETYKADRITKKGDQVVYTNPDSGAETRHVHLQVHNRNNPVDFETIAAGKSNLTGYRKPEFFVQNLRSGQISAVADSTFSKTDAAGQVIDHYRVASPLQHSYVDKALIEVNKQNVRKITDPAEAKRLWDERVAKIPEFRTNDLHIITGAILPIWDRLGGQPRVYRLQTESGETMLGRVVDNKQIDATLKRLGAEGLKIEATPAQIVERVLDGDDATLANGWTIKRSRVAGDWRIELKGPTFQDFPFLQQDGVFSERINYATRYFIPTGDRAADVIKAITANKPVVSLGGGAGGPQFAMRAKQPQSLLSFLAANGGIKDEAGELRARDLTKARPGLVRNAGKSLDYAREAAEEAGYLKPGSTVADLLNAIDEELSGRKVYAPEDTAAAIEAEQGRAAEVEGERFDDLRTAAATEAEQAGASLRGAEADHAAGMMLEGEPTEAAVREAARVGDLERMGEPTTPPPWETGERLPSAEALRRLERAAATDPTLTPEAREARARMYQAAEGMMRFMGLPEKVGLNFVDKIEVAGRGDADGAYTRGLVTFALDTAATEAPFKVWHEAIHALMDPKLGLLNEGQRRALEVGANRWLNEGRTGVERRAELRQMGYSKAQMLDEAVSRMAEDALRRGLQPRSALAGAIERMQNFTRGVGQMLRGQGFRTADDVFNAMLRGKRALPGSQEAMVGERINSPINSPNKSANPAGEGKGEEKQGDNSAASNYAELRQITPKYAEPSGMPRMTAMDELRRLSEQDVQFALRPTPKTLAEAKKRIEQLPYIGRALQVSGEKALDIGALMRDMVTPMAGGSDQSRAQAKDYANIMRLARYEGTRIQEWLTKTFKPDQWKDMWNAADEQSVAMQESRPTTGIGLDRLAPDERDAVETMQSAANEVFAQAQQLKMVRGEGLPSYVPRMVVEMTAEGARPLSGRGVRNISEFGRDVSTTTKNLRRRKYLTKEETERAAKIATDNPNAVVVEDIRVLPLATAKLMEAVAGRTLINQIKEAGRRAGHETVAEGAAPEGSPYKWFTIKESPAFWTWQPRMETVDGRTRAMVDADGQVVFDKIPLYVRGDYEAPLKAVLSKRGGTDTPAGRVYDGIMELKGRIMTGIMWGMVHGTVIAGRILPKAANLVSLYREGNIAREDPDIMHRFLMSGGVPIGHNYGWQEISNVLNGGVPKDRYLSSMAVRWVMGDNAAARVDKVNDFVHNTLVWDTIGKWQMGLFTRIERAASEKGHDPQTAARIAAHIANRLAGSMPAEAMSAGTQKAANLLLFSRSYRLGGLGQIKDMFNGLPRDIRSQIARDQGADVANDAAKYARRSTNATLAADMGIYYIGNSLFQSAANVLLNDVSLDDEMKGYVRRFVHEMGEIAGNPWRALNPLAVIEHLTPLEDNEPGKQNRILVGRKDDGTGIYVRNPAGKFAEDLLDYSTRIMDTMKRIISPFARVGEGVWSNDRGFGRQIYDPYTSTAPEILKAAGQIALYAVEQGTPMTSFWNPATNLAKNAVGMDTVESPAMSAAKIAGSAVGLTFSQGYPGGPAKGEYAHAKKVHEFQVQQVMPKVREAVKLGRLDEARAIMEGVKVPPRDQASIIRGIQNPGTISRRQFERFRYFAPQDAQDRLERQRGLAP